MTITAVEAKAADVMLMAERDGLLTRNVLFGNIRRTHQLITETDKEDRQHPKPGERKLGDRIGPGSENLRHAYIPRYGFRCNQALLASEFNSSKRLATQCVLLGRVFYSIGLFSCI